MPINWNGADYVAPKIQIMPEQLPLEAAMKTGQVLQDRYDKSYENYTKAEEFARQMVNQAHDIDKERVKEIASTYGSELKKIAESGDYHNMRWQTLKLAQQAADNFANVAERKKHILAQEEAISKDPRYAFSRDQRLNEFRKGLSPLSFDAENRTFTGLDISPYSAAADVDKVKFYAGYGKLMEPIIRSIKNREFVPLDINGKELPADQLDQAAFFRHSTTSGKQAILSADKLFSTLVDVGKADENIKAVNNRDANYFGKTADEIFAEQDIPAIKAVAKLLVQDKRESQTQDNITGNPKFNVDGGGDGSFDDKNPDFVQRPSADFNQNITAPFKVDDKGKIVGEVKKEAKFLNSPDQGYLGKTAAILNPVAYATHQLLKTVFKGESFDKINETNNVTRKRLVTLLEERGVIPKDASYEVQNKAIAEHWNKTLSQAHSTILMAKPGDKTANQFLDEVNKTFFGDATPDDKKTGTSILNGQLANATFIDEKGVKQPAKQVINATKDKNVRITGYVNDATSPFEYGSYYMTATGEDGEVSHYLIEPDLETKNTGKYFSNRIYNSVNSPDVVSKWEDGYGNKYRATPIEGGNKFIVDINDDYKKPIILEQQDLMFLERLPVGMATQFLQEIKNQK